LVEKLGEVASDLIKQLNPDCLQQYFLNLRVGILVLFFVMNLATFQKLLLSYQRLIFVII